MLRFTLFGFPVAVHWMFWVIVALLGGGAGAQSSQQVAALVLFVFAAFLSVLIHELGHAFFMRKYGAYASIMLYAFGGMAIPNRGFSRTQSIMVSVAGPLWQITAGVVVLLISRQLPDAAWSVKTFFGAFILVSFFWGILNLLPIYPLDGGHILSGILGPRRQQITYGVGMILAGLLAVWMLVSWGSIFNALFFGLFAFQNFQRMRGEQPNSMLNPRR